MPFEIITIPFNVSSKCFYADELNRFCLNKNVLKTEVEFFRDDKQAYWTAFIEYGIILENTKDEPDTKCLTEAGKLCYERLREWRKETAEKEGIPPYVIARNSHLSEIIKREIKTLEALKQIHGFGNRKVEKYGKDIIDIINIFYTAPHEG